MGRMSSIGRSQPSWRIIVMNERFNFLNESEYSVSIASMNIRHMDGGPYLTAYLKLSITQEPLAKFICCLFNT